MQHLPEAPEGFDEALGGSEATALEGVFRDQEHRENPRSLPKSLYPIRRLPEWLEHHEPKEVTA